MNIHQLSVNTQDLKEFRFWLTRRMSLRLMPAIEQSAERLEAAQPGVAVTDAPAQQLLSELKRDAFLKKADFATPFENRATHWPLGAEPLLITDAHLSIQPGGALEISFEDKSDPAQARSCQLHLQVSLVHGMAHLIRQASEKAEWLAVSSPIQATEAGPKLPQEPPRYPH